MKFSLSLLFAMALVIMARAQSPSYILNGIIPADPARPDVVKAANFAVNDRYVLEDVTYKILIAKEQRVAGQLYYLTIAVTEDDGASCTVMSYVVWEKAGAPADRPYTLNEVEELTNEEC
jgi:Cystatin domain